MVKPTLEPEAFAHIDELVQQFLKSSRNIPALTDLRKMMLEAEMLVACIDRLDEWIQVMEHHESGLLLHEAWLQDRERQICELYRGCDELIEVAIEIIPARVVWLIRPHLH